MTINHYPVRMWINQPSTHQPHHKLHGVRVLAVMEGTTARVYFLKGPVIDQEMMTSALSEGWPPDSRTNPKVPFKQEEDES